MSGTEKEFLEEKVQILELQCDAANERIKTLEKELEESKLKWHDLRKNPEDLPKKDCDVALKVYNHRDKEIITDSGFYKGNMFYHWKSGYRILAWVELPKFEEKKNNE